MNNNEITKILSDSILFTSDINKELFTKKGVKRGLRNDDHSGVLAGLTRIGDVVGFERQTDGSLKPIPGKLSITEVSTWKNWLKVFKMRIG